MRSASSSFRRLAQAASAALALAGPVAAGPALNPLETLGKSLFEDRALSVNRDQPCMFCHHPGMGFTSPHPWVNAGGAVVPGSVPGAFGNRKPPSIAYAALVPPFTVAQSVPGGAWVASGGLFLDGRAKGEAEPPLVEQAGGPLLNPLEMALPAPVCVVLRACRPEHPPSYPVRMEDVWGPEICALDFPPGLDAQCGTPGARVEMGGTDPERVQKVFGAVLQSLAAFEASAEVNPFSSRFDRRLEGRAALAPAEEAGLALFVTHCASCHALAPLPGATLPLLTDFTYANLGVPPNPENPWYAAHENPEGRDWRDPGLAATLAARPDLAPLAPLFAGAFRVPTLRNVARTMTPPRPKAFMHNGYFKSLQGVVRFLNTRDVWPRCTEAFVTEKDALARGCWPAPEIDANIDRTRTGALGLTGAEEAALVAFLGTLSDGEE